MSRVVYTDYEAFAQAIQDASLTMRLCSLEEARWDLQEVTADDVHLQKAFEGGGSISEGITSGEGWTFYWQSLPVLANGQILKLDEVFAAPPGSEFCLSCQPRHEWFTVFIPTSLLFPASPDLDFATFDRPQLLKPSPHTSRRFMSLARRFLSSSEFEPDLVTSPCAVDAFRAQLASTTRELFATSQFSSSSHFVRWWSHIKSTVEHAIRQPESSLSVSELARRDRVPERTLRTAFQRCYGLSPQEFLRVYRLHQARLRLLASCPDETTVTQVAFGLGFWDLGRFAAAYRRLFKERPSETLRRVDHRT